MVVAVVTMVVPVVATQSPALAAPVLTITPITWNVIGLDSNSPATSGPEVFPVAARICNTGTTASTGVTSTFVFDSANAFISAAGPTTLALGDLAAGACVDASYNVTVTRVAAAFDTTRAYHITASATGVPSIQTPTNRELYIERLVSQNRNAVLGIAGPAVDTAPSSAGPGHATVVVGQTYTFTVTSKTATGGYEQVESFLNFPNTIFQILGVTSTYAQPTGGTNDKIYADACGWDNDLASASYLSCIGPENYAGGKAGGNPIVTTYTVKVIAAGSGVLSNLIYDFSGSSYHYNSDFGTNVNSLAFDAVLAPDVSITKSHVGNFTVGTNGTYTLTVANPSGSPTTGPTTVSDTLPAGLTFVSAAGTGFTCSTAGQLVTCTRASALPAGSTVPITLTVGVGVAASPSVTNTASVATAGDSNPANNFSSDPTTVAAAPAQADLAIAKNGAATVNAGGQIAYSLTVTNNGPGTAATPTVTDSIPANLGSPATTTAGCTIAGGALTCNLANLANGASTAVSLTGTAPASGAVTNTATVSSTTTDPTPANNSSTLVTTVTPQADLVIVKTGPASVTAGGTISHTLTVTNNGPSTAVAPTVTDTIPANLASASTPTPGCGIAAGTLTCTLANLANGASAAVTLTGSAPASGTVTNTASVSSTTTDPVPGNNSSTAVTAVTPQADLAMVKTGPASVNAGGSITYTLTVTNNGPSTAVAPTIADAIPAGLGSPTTPTAGCAIAAGTFSCSLPDLASGATAAVILTGTAPASGTVVNTATASSATADPTAANNSSTLVTTIAPQADLAVVKSAPASVSAGGAVTYTLTVTNNGPSAAVAPVVTDAVPANLGAAATPTAGCAVAAGVLTCALSDMASGTTAVVILTGTAPASGSVSNTATVASSTADPVPANNSSTAMTTVTPQADLAIVKTGPASVNVGGAVTYTMTVTNNGPSTAAAPTITDILPAGLGSPATPTAGCAIAGGTLTCTLASLASGASAGVTLTGTAPTAGTLTNSATVASTTGDPTPGNNSSTAVTTVVAVADLAIEKTEAVTGGNNTATAADVVTAAAAATSEAPAAVVPLPLVAQTLPVTGMQPGLVRLAAALLLGGWALRLGGRRRRRPPAQGS